jgi:hypothetical protein
MVALLALSANACGGGARAARPVEAPRVDAPLAASAPRLAEGVIAMEPLAAEDAPERCDGLDSNGDGHIDEGCEGVSSGAIELALAWSGGADLDLVLDGPGDSVGVSSRGDCAPESAPIERRVVVTAEAGEYVVRVHHADGCGGDAPVWASVSVAATGQLLGAFNRSVAPGETVDVVAFDLAPAE